MRATWAKHCRKDLSREADVTLEKLLPIYESARTKPAVVQIEAHPYLPETELLEFCKEKDIVFLAFAPLGHGIKPGPLEDPVILAIAARVGKTPRTGAVGFGGATWHGFAYHGQNCRPRTREFRHLSLPEDAFDEINRIQTRRGWYKNVQLYNALPSRRWGNWKIPHRGLRLSWQPNRAGSYFGNIFPPTRFCSSPRRYRLLRQLLFDYLPRFYQKHLFQMRLYRQAPFRVGSEEGIAPPPSCQ
jgi:hypothetical protein